jgi:FkbM family methyltransferase
MLIEPGMRKIINPFTYALVAENGLLNPTIPSWIHETYGQCFEDVIVCQMIRAFAARTNVLEFRLSYVEIGANHPVSTSTSLLLHRMFDVCGVLVEPNPLLAVELRKHRSFDHIIEAAVYDGPESEIDLFMSPQNEISSLSATHVGVVKTTIDDNIKVKTIDINSVLNIMIEQQTDHYLLSIDVEGLDLRILNSIDFTKHRPLMIQIESSEDFYPGNTNKMIEFLASNNYVLVSVNFVNLLFFDRARM